MEAIWLDAVEQTPITAAELQADGIVCEQLSLVAEEYQPFLTKLQNERGYIANDEVQLSKATHNLDEICEKFLAEHRHDEDEVRFVLQGEGIFDIRSKDDRWMRIKVTPGDLVIVPSGRYHRFMLTELQEIRCVRLFQDASGWVPVYRTDTPHGAS